MEDDIQYMGMNSPLRTTAKIFNSEQMRPITGLCFHVIKANGIAGESHVFYKTSIPIIHIGRGSSKDDGKTKETDTVTFDCPVISRKQAKILLSETGHVYLVDLKSRHGTHILKVGETVSSIIAPETPTMLEDGDTVTFGKTVGQESNTVRPVTIRIRLLHNPEPSTAAAPATTVTTSSEFTSKDKGKAPMRFSGRYGVFLPSSLSSSSSDSSSVRHDSDVEEIDPPEEYPIRPASDDSLLRRSSSHGPNLPSLQGLGLLGRILPPLHSPQSSQGLPRQNSIHRWFRDQLPNLTNDNDAVAVEDDEDEPSDMEESRSPSPVISDVAAAVGDDSAMTGVYPESPDLLPSDWPRLEDVFGPAMEEEDELATPNVDVEVVAGVAQRSNEGSDDMEMEVEKENLSEPSVEAESQPSAAPVPEPESRPEPVARPASEAPIATTSSAPTGGEDISFRVAKIDSTLVEMRSSVLRLSIDHRRTQQEQKAFSERSDGLDKRIDETTTLTQSLQKRVDVVSDSSTELREELATITSRLDGVDSELARLREQAEVRQAELDELRAQQEQSVPAPVFVPSVEMLESALAGREDVRSSVDALNDLVQEMKALRASAAANIENELEGLKAIRSDALAKLGALEALEQQHREQLSVALAAMTSSSTPSQSQSTSRSLKRKRSIEDGDDGEEVECDDDGDMSVESADRRVAKRMRTGRGTARRILSAVAKTTGVMTVGAIVTWTALAFAPETF